MPVITALTRVPPVATAALLVVGAVLADLHVAVLTPEPGEPEPAQWLGRTTILLYYLLLPVAFLALWARFRTRLGLPGRIAAAMIAVQVPVYLVLTAMTLVWGLLLGRGDLSGRVTWIEGVGVALLYLGAVVLAVTFLVRGPGRGRVIGALVLGGFLGSFVVPWLLTCVYGALAVVVAREQTSPRSTAGTPAPVAH